MPRLAEASCASVVRTAKAVVADVGVAAASSSTGLTDLASRTEKNAERDCHRLMVKRFELALPITRSYVDTGDSEECKRIPVLLLTDWLRFLVQSNHTNILVGLEQPDWHRERCILRTFWERYQVQHPKHPIFERARMGELDLEKTYPMLMHGDEGRGRKRTAFLVVSFHSVIGFGVKEKQKKKRSCRKKKSKKSVAWVRMRPNYAGSTLTTRFLLACMPKSLYTGSNWETWDAVMSKAASEAHFLFETGVEDQHHGRGTFRVAVLHITGDWPFLADSGYFLRSFRNVPKHKTRTRAPVGICHQCQAGQLGVDFEEIQARNPKWLSTLHSQPVFDEGFPSPLAQICHVPGELGSLWAYDIFHTWHLGVARSFLGSCIALLSELQPEPSIDDRFQSLSEVYLSWCSQSRRRAHVRSLTKDLIGWPTKGSYPAGGWHKGDLSTTLMAWFQSRFEAECDSWDEMLQVAGEGSKSINSCLASLYHGEVWLRPSHARTVGEQGLCFLKIYSKLAKMAWQQQRNLWVLQPKLHALHHLFLQMVLSSELGAVLNPICLGTQADEDFIGRPSRLSRRVTADPIACCDRVLSRHLQNSYDEWTKAGFIVRALPEEK